MYRQLPAGVNREKNISPRSGQIKSRTVIDDHARSQTYSTDPNLSIYSSANFSKRKTVPHHRTPYAPSAEFSLLGQTGVPFAPNPRFHKGVPEQLSELQQREK